MEDQDEGESNEVASLNDGRTGKDEPQKKVAQKY